MYMGTHKKPHIHLVRASMYEYSQKTSHPFSEGFNVYGYSQKPHIHLVRVSMYMGTHKKPHIHLVRVSMYMGTHKKNYLTSI